MPLNTTKKHLNEQHSGISPEKELPESKPESDGCKTTGDGSEDPAPGVTCEFR